MEATVQVAELTEQERIEQWRLRELIHAGYAPDEALELSARFDVNLHQACDLLAQGCPSALATAILL